MINGSAHLIANSFISATEGLIPTFAVITQASSTSPIGEGFSLNVTFVGAKGLPIVNLTGTVNFYDGLFKIATVPVDAGGIATWIARYLDLGLHNLYAVYSGDTQHTSSQSYGIGHTITPITEEISRYFYIDPNCGAYILINGNNVCVSDPLVTTSTAVSGDAT